MMLHLTSLKSSNKRITLLMFSPTFNLRSGLYGTPPNYGQYIYMSRTAYHRPWFLEPDCTRCSTYSLCPWTIDSISLPSAACRRIEVVCPHPLPGGVPNSLVGHYGEG